MSTIVRRIHAASPRGWLVVLLLASPGACGDDTTAPIDGGPDALALERVTGGLQSPVWLTAPAGDVRLFVVEQPGRVRVIRDGQLVEQPFLDITAKVGSGGERGLLSVAFHPQYASNGFFYVDYTDRNGDSQIERYRVSSNADIADAASAKPILSVAQPFSNHNGGLIVFGPDGRLYIGLGDGGSGGDPRGNGQNRNTLLGSILRIDVDAGDPYAIPADNPFVGQAGARGEIWAWGLRNPWRYSFDDVDGLIYIADVGQSQWEEIDVMPAGTKGINYGWNVREGKHCYDESSCQTNGLTDPVLEFGHGPACSVTGGFVYRGSSIPELVGHYVYSDYCAGFIRSFRYANGNATDEKDWSLNAGSVLSFGRDAAGEIYVLNAAGDVLRIVRD